MATVDNEKTVSALVIEDGVVVNILAATESMARENGWIVSNEGDIGDTYDERRGTFTSNASPAADDDMPVAEHRRSAIDWIDATADRVRASDRSVGQYLDAEYQLVAQALADYRAHPDAEVPEAIRSYAVAEGLTAEAAAQQIAEAAARVQELLQDVRRIRLAGKAAIRDAGDEADFMETARPFIDQLEALAIVQSAISR
ncbi:hypothetical protein [Kushneria sp. TE3]|uniref:hypothetical protein n=1 Tax=Kushneria sp. TE3 TaxID=3449832 RepID=UPI003F6863BB